MTDKPENPPAFPRPEVFFSKGAEGLKLRDWFAGQAIAGSAKSGNLSNEGFAKHAYEIADAMLKERSKTE